MPDDKNKQPDVTIDPTKLDLSKNPAFAQLTSLVTQIAKGQQTFQAALTTQSKSLGELTEALKKGGGGNPPKKEDKQTTDDDVNNMSQAELATHIFKGVRGLMDTMKTELSTSIEKVSTSFEKKNLQSEVEQVRSDHKDFDEWIPEVKEKMQANPGLTIKEAYTLVRSNNAEKAKEMDTKYKVGLEGDDGKDKKQVFGGLTPTSRIGADESNDGGDKQMTQAEAAEAAWAATFGDNPDLAGPDDAD